MGSDGVYCKGEQREERNLMGLTGSMQRQMGWKLGCGR